MPSFNPSGPASSTTTTASSLASSRAGSLKSHPSSSSLRRQPSRPEIRTSTLSNHNTASAASTSSSHLRPEDAFYQSPPRAQDRFTRASSPLGRSDTVTQRNSSSWGSAAGVGNGDAQAQQQPQLKKKPSSSSVRGSTSRNTSRSARRRHLHRTGNGTLAAPHGPWKKLLWVKQSYPDNYTDEATFLDHLQLNPRWRPYEFWPLVADSTIIVQHLASVVIFVCCFVGIFEDRVSPATVVGVATAGTVGSWVWRDWWMGRGEGEDGEGDADGNEGEELGEMDGAKVDGLGFQLQHSAAAPGEDDILSPSSSPVKTRPVSGISSVGPSRSHSRHPSGSHVTAAALNSHSLANALSNTPTTTTLTNTTPYPPYDQPGSSSYWNLSARTRERLTTAKSALLIYCCLLGLSPILKSLTLSTSSDSIWALSSWLMGINVFTFDYGAGPGAKFPASLSTNAALMASTVLASRLPSTTHVFSLTLFSIEVFGLFPVFRRHLRFHSWTGHCVLTMVLVGMAGGGTAMVVSGGGWGIGVLGVVLGALVTGLGMGLTSWWLIGLQRYKNEIHGPWDPARPIIRMR